MIKVLLNALALRARSQYEIIEITGLVNTTVSRWLKLLHATSKELKNIVYIESYRRVGERGQWTALWKLGYGMADAVKPGPMSMKEYKNRWRNKKAAKPHVTLTKEGLIHVSK